MLSNSTFAVLTFLCGPVMINCNVYERLVKRFDEDGDGKLSPWELQRCVGSIGEELLMEEAREVVESMD